ncbi:MAG: hypothetical protein ACR2F1_12080 [Nitrososphaeraceae archaeon]
MSDSNSNFEIPLKQEDGNDLNYVTNVILKEARLENRLTSQLLVTLLSAYSNNPINLLINAPSGVGKNYVIHKVSSLFPKSDILALAGMTEKALFHRPGTLVIKDVNGQYQSIEPILADIQNDISEKESQLSQTTDKSLRQELKNSIKTSNEKKTELLKDSKKLIDLSNKIIIFLDTPPEHLLSSLLPLLSHDEYEVEYEYVDTNNGIKTKSNVLRGWPAVVIAQALDYSNSPRFHEYQRRFITTNPTMTTKKYNEAIDLISNKFSLPDLVYQNEIVSDYDKDKAREIIIRLKEQIQAICMDLQPGKNNVIIPFSKLILRSLPKEKASDMTRANRLFTYLAFLPTVNFDKRPRIEIGIDGDILSKQIITIATFEDLQKTVSLMEYSDGVRPYILEWYYDVFYKAYDDKEDTPDSKIITTTTSNSSSNKGKEETRIEEKRTAVTSQNLLDKHKNVHGETLTAKNLLQSYIYPLLNHGYIDKIDSILDRRARIYFPIIETKKYINLFYSGEKNNFSQETDKIVVNSTIFPSQVYMHSVFEPILKYYSANGLFTKIKNHLDEEISIDELVDQYFGNPDDYFIKQKQEQKQEEPAVTAEVKGWNSTPNPTDNLNNPNPVTSTTITQQEKEEEKKEET